MKRRRRPERPVKQMLRAIRGDGPRLYRCHWRGTVGDYAWRIRGKHDIEMRPRSELPKKLWDRLLQKRGF